MLIIKILVWALIIIISYLISFLVWVYQDLGPVPFWTLVLITTAVIAYALSKWKIKKREEFQASLFEAIRTRKGITRSKSKK